MLCESGQNHQHHDAEFCSRISGLLAFSRGDVFSFSYFVGTAWRYPQVARSFDYPIFLQLGGKSFATT